MERGLGTNTGATINSYAFTFSKRVYCTTEYVCYLTDTFLWGMRNVTQFGFKKTLCATTVNMYHTFHFSLPFVQLADFTVAILMNVSMYLRHFNGSQS